MDGCVLMNTGNENELKVDFFDTKIANLLPGAMIILEGEIFYANDYFCNKFGLSINCFCRQELFRFIAKKDLEKAEKFFLKKNNDVCEIDFICNQKAVCIFVSKKTSNISNGQIMFFSFDDITEKKLLQNELLVAQKMEAIGMLAGGVVHDCNNILMVIEGNLYFLKENCFFNQDAKIFFDNAINAVKAIGELIGNLIGSRKKNSKHQEEIDIKAFLRDIAWPVNYPIFTISLCIDDCRVLGDRDEIKRVLENLVRNALEETNFNGNLSLGVKRIGANVIIYVSDDGRGVPDEIKKEIFKPFFSTKKIKAGKNFGLGLASCLAIASRHKGFIRVLDNEPKGAIFEIVLPAIK